MNLRQRAKSFWAWLISQLTWNVLAATNVILLIAVVLLLSRSHVMAALREIPQTVVTLAAAVIAFWGVAWQTRIGFRNLIASQEHRAKIERDAREEEHKRELEAEKRKRDTSAKALAAALRGELVAYLDFVTKSANSLIANASLYEAMSKQGLTESATPRFAQFKARIYEASISKLDHLGASLVGDLVKVLSHSFNTPSFEMTKVHPKAAETACRMMSALYEAAYDDIYHVAMRLRAFEWGEQDPGTLLERDVQKAKDTAVKAAAT